MVSGGRARDRARAERSGVRAESLAMLWLMLRGYRLVARRFRTPVGEIDLIARRGGRIAFIEVKRRASLAEAREAVTPRQQDRVRRAAIWWLGQQSPVFTPVYGFDVVLVAPWRLPVHVVDAFTHLP